MARVKPPLSAAGRVHDMGGQPGGPVPIDPQGQPVFAQNWQARALAVTVAAGGLGKWTLDESRHARERLPAEDYMAYGYYEKCCLLYTSPSPRDTALSRMPSSA